MNFIEVVEKDGMSRLINLDSVMTIKPDINGKGAVIYFDPGYNSGYVSISVPTYKELVTLLNKKQETTGPNLLNENVSKPKKNGV